MHFGHNSVDLIPLVNRTNKERHRSNKVSKPLELFYIAKLNFGMERYPKLQHKMGGYPPILDPFVDNFRTHSCILFKFYQPLSQKINFKILSDKRGNICRAFPSHAQWEQVKHVKISVQRNSQRPTLPPGQSLSLLLKFSLYGDSWMMVDDVNIGRHLGSQRK